jgi:NAD(P)-dependent dehydrogenase (short-subunit alcohol dehydrogenase family)
MNRVEGKVALISGAARGIGAASARLLGQGGARVVLGDVLEEEGQATAQEIQRAGGTAVFVRLDVTREEDWARAVGLAGERFGGLDVLVNNAGIYHYRTLEETSLADWRRVMAVNLDGVFLGTRAALGAMKQRKAESWGSIINTSSTAAMVGAPGVAAYSATKGGVRAFTRATAIECARLGYRVRVNAVLPGVIESDMGRQVLDEIVRTGTMGGEAEVRNFVLGIHPVGRLGAPVDVAQAIVYLASDDAAFVTGMELVVDGGFTAQ